MSNDTVTLKFDEIKMNTDGMTNCRSDLGDLNGLKESIEEEGLLQNVGVWQPPGKDYYVLSFGFRRHAAIGLIREQDPLFMDDITCAVVGGGLSDAQSTNLIENIKRQNLNHADLAARLGDMYVNRGMKEIEIAKKVGLSQPQVSNLVAVSLKCIPAVLQALKKGWVNLATTKKLARLTEEKQAEALESLLDEEQSTDIESWMKKQDKGSKKPGVAILRQKLKQVEAHPSEYDPDFRKGVCIGILYSMGLVADEKTLMHPPEKMPEAAKPSGGHGRASRP